MAKTKMYAAWCKGFDRGVEVAEKIDSAKPDRWYLALRAEMITRTRSAINFDDFSTTDWHDYSTGVYDGILTEFHSN